MGVFSILTTPIKTIGYGIDGRLGNRLYAQEIAPLVNPIREAVMRSAQSGESKAWATLKARGPIGNGVETESDFLTRQASDFEWIESDTLPLLAEWAELNLNLQKKIKLMQVTCVDGPETLQHAEEVYPVPSFDQKATDAEDEPRDTIRLHYNNDHWYYLEGQPDETLGWGNCGIVAFLQALIIENLTTFDAIRGWVERSKGEVDIGILGKKCQEEFDQQFAENLNKKYNQWEHKFFPSWREEEKIVQDTLRYTREEFSP